MAIESSEGEEEGRSVLSVDEDDLIELGKKAVWSVSSCKAGNGVSSLRDDNLDTYWQSDGALPHLVNVQFQKKVKLQLVALYLDYKLDESYTPSKVSVRAGDGFHNLKEIKSTEIAKPNGWVYISLSGNDPRYAGFSFLSAINSGNMYPAIVVPTTVRENDFLKKYVYDLRAAFGSHNCGW